MVTGATKPLLRQNSNNTTTTHNEHMIAEPLDTQQNPNNQVAIAFEKLASRNNGKFEYFGDIFHTTLRMQPTLTRETKINHFHTHLRGLALKTFKIYPTNTNNYA